MTTEARPDGEKGGEHGVPGTPLTHAEIVHGESREKAPPAQIEAVSDFVSGTGNDTLPRAQNGNDPTTASPVDSVPIPATTPSDRGAYIKEVSEWKKDLRDALFASETTDKEAEWFEAALSAAEAHMLEGGAERSKAEFLAEMRSSIQQDMEKEAVPDGTVSLSPLASVVEAHINESIPASGEQTVKLPHVFQRPPSQDDAPTTIQSPITEVVGGSGGVTPIEATTDSGNLTQIEAGTAVAQTVQDEVAVPAAFAVAAVPPATTSAEGGRPITARNGSGKKNGSVPLSEQLAAAFPAVAAASALQPKTGPGHSATPPPTPRPPKAARVPAQAAVSGEASAEDVETRKERAKTELAAVGRRILDLNKIISLADNETKRKGGQSEADEKVRRDVRERNHLRTQAKELAVEIAGRDELFDLIKTPDIENIKKTKRLGALQRDERIAVKAAQFRMKRFMGLLGADMSKKRLSDDERDGVNEEDIQRNIAFDIYNDFHQHAKAMARLSGKLATIKNSDRIDLSPAELHLLHWYGDKKGNTPDEVATDKYGVREDTSVEEFVKEVAGIAELQRTVPLRVLTPVEQAREDMRGVSWDALREQLAKGDDAARVLAESEWERRALNTIRERGENRELRQALTDIKSGNGANVPKQLLRTFQDIPVVARYLRDRGDAASSPVPATEAAPVVVTAPNISGNEVEPVVPVRASSLAAQPSAPGAAPSPVQPEAAVMADAELPQEEKLQIAKILNALGKELDVLYKNRKSGKETKDFYSEVERINRACEQAAIRLAGASELREFIKIGDENWSEFLHKTEFEIFDAPEETKRAIRDARYRKFEFNKLLIGELNEVPEEDHLRKSVRGTIFTRFHRQADALNRVSHDITQLIAEDKPSPVIDEMSDDFYLLRLHGVPAELIREGKLAEISAIISPQVERYSLVEIHKAPEPSSQTVENFRRDISLSVFDRYGYFKDYPEIQKIAVEKAREFIRQNDTTVNFPEWVDVLMKDDPDYRVFREQKPATPPRVDVANISPAAAATPLVQPEQKELPPGMNERDIMMSDPAVGDTQQLYLKHRHEIVDALREAQHAGQGGLAAQLEGELEKLNAWYNTGVESEKGGAGSGSPTPNSTESIVSKNDAYWSAFEANRSPADRKRLDEKAKGLTLEAIPLRPESSGELPELTDEVGRAEVLLDLDLPKSQKENGPVKPLNHGVVRRFASSFEGITESELEKIPGFAALSEGQQLLTLKNLQSMVFDKVKGDARDKEKDEWENMNVVKRTFLQIWNLGARREKRIAQFEKAFEAQHRSATGPKAKELLSENLDALKDLVQVAEQGPDVNINKKTGELEISYVSKKDMFTSVEEDRLTGDNLKAMERYNSAADKFAKYPHEWGYDADRSRVGMMEKMFSRDRRDYNAAVAEYDAARRGMLALYVERATARGDKQPERSAALEMNKTDERVQLNQLFNAHPDAEKALLKIQDQSVLRIAAKEFWKGKGFVVYGMAMRAAAVAVSGAVALPAVFAIGGIAGAGVGAAEAKKLIKERRTDGRMSEEELREVVSYDILKKKPGKEGERGEIFLDDNKQPVVLEVKKREIKEYTDANFFVDRIQRLSNKLEQTMKPEERALIEKKIVQTVVLMREKNARGMINFSGSELEEGDERKGASIVNRLNFMQAMAKGEIDTTIDRDALEKMIHDAAATHQGRIEDVRKGEVWRAAGKSTFIRGTAALAGGLIAEEYINPLLQEHVIPRVRDWLGMGEQGVSSVPNADVAKSPPAPAPAATPLEKGDLGAFMDEQARLDALRHSPSAPASSSPTEVVSAHERLGVAPGKEGVHVASAPASAPSAPVVQPQATSPAPVEAVPPSASATYPSPEHAIPAVKENVASRFRTRDWGNPEGLGAGTETANPSQAGRTFKKFEF